VVMLEVLVGKLATVSMFAVKEVASLLATSFSVLLNVLGRLADNETKLASPRRIKLSMTVTGFMLLSQNNGDKGSKDEETLPWRYRETSWVA
jgi:hypothetical protein